MRGLLIAAALVFSADAGSQAGRETGQRDEIAKFRARLMADVARFKGRYPPAASEQRLEPPGLRGVAFSTDVRLRFSLNPGKGHGEWKA
jgi:hypothetical protein